MEERERESDKIKITSKKSMMMRMVKIACGWYAIQTKYDVQKQDKKET